MINKIYTLLHRRCSLLRKPFALIFLFSFSAGTGGSCSLTDDCSVIKNKTMLSLMPQGADSKTQYHYVTPDSYLTDMHLSMNITYRYQEARNTCNLAKMLFGDSTLLFQGINYGLPQEGELLNPVFAARRLGPRTSNALIADYFGMGSSTNSSVTIVPLLVNNIIDIKIDFRPNMWAKGLWFQMNLPVVNARWQLKTNGAASSTPFPEFLQDQGTYLVDGSVMTATQFQEILEVERIISPRIFVNPPVPLTQPIEEFIPVSYVQGTQAFTSDVFSYQSEPYVDVTGAVKVVPVGGGIEQDAVASAFSLAQAINGYTFGDLRERTYAKISLAPTSECSSGSAVEAMLGLNQTTTSYPYSQWNLDGVYLQAGYDIIHNENNHVGFYIKGVIPTGTSIDSIYQEQVLKPIVGNGKRFEFGAGLSAHAMINLNDAYKESLSFNFDSYINHVFSAMQFRIWDLNDSPMSRYALLKTFTQTPYLSDSPFEDFTDEYTYNGLVAVADVNNQCSKIGAALHGEVMLDIIYNIKNWNLGFGYNLKMQSKEKVDWCDSCGRKAYNPSVKYGKKGAIDTSTIFIEIVGVTSPSVSTKVNTIGVATNSWCDPDATAYSYTPRSLFEDPQQDFFIDMLQTENRSALMEKQMLNIVFGHIDYLWDELYWQPSLGVVGSVGFSSSSAPTAQYWDVGGRFGFSY